VNVLGVQETKSKLRKLRQIHAVFVVSIPLLVWVAQSSCPSDSTHWTLWHWVITGLALYSAIVGFFFRRKLMRSVEDALRRDVCTPTALKKWQTAQLVAMAEAIAFYGVVLQMVLGGPLWQASFFYAVA
jgi:protein-S-isoprenylcysteine O-methyltransferase Ste14